MILADDVIWMHRGFHGTLRSYQYNRQFPVYRSPVSDDSSGNRPIFCLYNSYNNLHAAYPVSGSDPFINANSATAPGIVDADRQPILERSEVYSGVYGRASINLYAFNSNGNKGIACGLNNLQKIRDGEPLGGKSRAEDDFASEEEDDFLD